MQKEIRMLAERLGKLESLYEAVHGELRELRNELGLSRPEKLASYPTETEQGGARPFGVTGYGLRG